MKRITLSSIIAAVFLFGAVLNSCKNPGEGVTININTNVLKAPTAVQFVNAVPNAANQPGNFPVTIGGQDAASVVTANNKTVFTASEGRIFLALKKGVVPTEDRPIIFTVAAEVPGFTPATQTFRVTKDEPVSVVISLIEYANPVVGTGAKVQDDPLVGGTSATPITIETPSNPGMDEQAVISIPAGTQFLDASGNVISATKLESRIVNYGSDSQESLAAFPGGFNVTSVVGENGQAIPDGVAFTTAGFIAMDMYAGGTEVKRFSKPLDVKMDISKQLLNPETGVIVKEGDVVPVWSLNDKTGQWSFESNATIVKDASGNLSASFSASHLSYWNFDWAQGFCARELKLNINAPNYVGEYYYVYIENDKGYSSGAWIAITDKFTTSFRVPTGRIRVVIRDEFGNILTNTEYFDSCAQGTISLTMPQSTEIDVVNVDMVLKGVCPNKPVNANINSWVKMYEKNEGSSKAMTVWMDNGKVNIKVKNNTTYVIEALYGDKWKKTEILFTKTNFKFPGTITGTAIYVEATKTLNVDAQFPLPDCN